MTDRQTCSLPSPYSENDFPGKIFGLSAEKAAELFIRGGFEILEIRESEAEMMTGPVSTLLFDVLLPTGWIKTDEGYLRDDQNKYRGIVQSTQFGDPVRLELYCRYSMLRDPSPSWYKLGLEKPGPNQMLELVIDRSKTLKEDPAVINGGVLWYAYQESKPPTPENLEKALRNRTPEDRLGRPRRDPWLWVEKYYPEWEDPFAYW